MNLEQYPAAYAMGGTLCETIILRLANCWHEDPYSAFHYMCSADIVVGVTSTGETEVLKFRHGKANGRTSPMAIDPLI
jgi:hypothetical protein